MTKSVYILIILIIRVAIIYTHTYIYPFFTDVEHFISITCFGDNIEDEWFIVHLIYELTRLYDDLIVHVEDSDGYFVLIEAANYLPHWLNPDNADNRVSFIKTS